MSEIWDLYTNKRELTDKKIVRGSNTPIPENYYRMVVHICVFNTNNKMLVQQRQPFKEGFPNMWDISCGGHSITGESSQDAASRELFEEIGILHSFEKERPSITISFSEGYNDIYIIKQDIDISTLKLQYEEVKAVEWKTKEEILKMIDDGIFIPYKKNLIPLLFEYSDNPYLGTH